MFFFSVDYSLFRSTTWHALSPKLGSRWISSGELTSVLRPFYFAVHPDLFGQHPEQRVNSSPLRVHCVNLTVYISKKKFLTENK